MLPKFRTEDYAIWRACERLRIRPPDVLPEWGDNSVWGPAMLIAYSQIRDYEDQERDMNFMQCLGAKIF
jgi:hypothetical protein